MNHPYIDKLREIKSVAMASVDKNHQPQVRIIDIMLVEDNQIYFCTSRGKDFHKEIINNPHISLVGLTLEYQSIRASGNVILLDHQKEWIDRIFEHNPVMNSVYPNASRYILDAFCIKDITLEYFDLSKEPIFRETLSFGNAKPLSKGFMISDSCILCGLCAANCPQQCIQKGTPYTILQHHCLHCGLCYENCPVNAIQLMK